MRKHQLQVHKLTILSMMIALDVVLTPIFRIEGMAPMSSVVNILAGIMMGPVYALAMATVTAFIRMTTQGIPPLALTGATFGALLAGLFYKYGRKFYFSALGEILGTGIIGSIVSYPVMVLFTGSAAKLSWFIYTPRFFGQPKLVVHRLRYADQQHQPPDRHPSDHRLSRVPDRHLLFP